MQPKEDHLTIIDKISSTFLDTGVRCAKGGWNDKLSCFGICKAVLGLEVMDGVDSWVEVKSCFSDATGAEKTSRVYTTIGWFDAA